MTAGDAVLAKDFDIFATAGGARKVCYITGVVEHEDDSLKGPLTVSFSTSKDNAKFNTFEVKNAAGASVVGFSASEMADAFSAAALHVPEISEPPIWREPSSHCRRAQDDLIRRMSLAEKVAQLQNGAPAIPRLGLPAYNYWSEALHGVAANGNADGVSAGHRCGGNLGFGVASAGSRASSGSKAVQSSTITPPNTTATPNGLDGLTFWSPNINIFRDPRWGRGQETYGEDPFLKRHDGRGVHPGIAGP